MNFLYFKLCPLLLSCHKIRMRRAWLHLFCTLRYLYTLITFPYSESSVLQAEQSQPSQSLLMQNVPIVSASLWPFAGLPTSFLQAAYSLVKIFYQLSFISCFSGWTTLNLGGDPWIINQLSWIYSPGLLVQVLVQIHLLPWPNHQTHWQQSLACCKWCLGKKNQTQGPALWGHQHTTKKSP